MSERGIGGRTEDDADGRVFAFVGPVFAGVAEVEVHLPGVRVIQRAELEVDDDETAQAAMEEDEIHAIPSATHTQAALASDKGEVAAEFEQEGFKMSNEGVFEIALRVFVFQIQKLEHQRIAHGLIDGESVAGLRLRAFAEHRSLVFGKECALIKEAADLPVELSHAPTAAQGFLLVEAAGFFVLHREEFHIVRPRERETSGESAEERERVGWISV